MALGVAMGLLVAGSARGGEGEAAPRWPVRLVVWSGYDFPLSSAGPLPLRPGGGVSISAGAALAVRRVEGLELQATLGARQDGYSTGASVHRYEALQADLLVAMQRAHLRLATGFSMAIAPSISGSGSDALHFGFRDSLGLVAQAELTSGGDGPRSFVGLRLVWQTLQPVGLAGSQAASTLGLLAGVAL